LKRPDVDGKVQPNVPIDFFVKGSNYSSIEHEVICAAWCVPPTNVESPLLVLAWERVKVNETLACMMPFLTFSGVKKTPAALKTVGGAPHLVLMRQYL